MTTFAITDTVSQPYQGNTGPVSLFNNGPSTIYLDSTPGVGPLNGFTLPPMGQLQWNGSTPLFAVCATGRNAMLVSNPGTGQLDANRSRFWALLWDNTYPSPGQNINETVEVGHCETVLVKLTARNNPTTSVSAGDIFWYDNVGNLIGQERFEMQCLAVSATNRVDNILRVPVVGSVMQIVGTGFAGIRVQIFGTDRALPFQSYSRLTDDLVSPPVLVVMPTGTSASNQNITSDSWDLLQWPTPYADIIPFANMSNRVAILVNTAGITNAGTIRLRDIYQTNVAYGVIDIPTGGSHVYSEFGVPLRTPLMLDVISVAGGTMDISFTWL